MEICIQPFALVSGCVMCRYENYKTWPSLCCYSEYEGCIKRIKMKVAASFEPDELLKNYWT
jgi:hypothetical protein